MLNPTRIGCWARTARPGMPDASVSAATVFSRSRLDLSMTGSSWRLREHTLMKGCVRSGPNRDRSLTTLHGECIIIA
jgi:hypothetical protein